jgi:hypothetical protein
MDAYVGGPAHEFLKEQTSAVLTFNGGHAVQTREHIRFREVVRTGKVSASIIGTAEHAGHYSTVATATIEKLDILGRITADAIVSRVEGLAPKEVPDNPDMHPTTFFHHGSAFHGLKIDGKDYAPTLVDFTRDIPMDRDQKPIFEAMPNNGFRLRENAVGYMQMFTAPGRKHPREPFMEIAGFGRLYVGEVDFFKGRVTLSMLRLELKGEHHGRVTGPVACINGHPPPIKPVP